MRLDVHLHSEKKKKKKISFYHKAPITVGVYQRQDKHS